MSDIVHDLRSLEVRTDVAYHGDESRLFNSTMRAAADEIERLRTQGNGLADRVGSLFRETQELYRHIATKQPWIAVSERLPDLEESVMVGNAKDGWVCIGSRQLTGEYHHWDGDDFEELNEPTHWMPLPEPPVE
jgi:hypothetical protein